MIITLIIFLSLQVSNKEYPAFQYADHTVLTCDQKPAVSPIDLKSTLAKTTTVQNNIWFPISLSFYLKPKNQINSTKNLIYRKPRDAI